MRFDGSLSSRRRVEVLNRFSTPLVEGNGENVTNPKVMLISLKSVCHSFSFRRDIGSHNSQGALGLNLTGVLGRLSVWCSDESYINYTRPSSCKQRLSVSTMTVQPALFCAHEGGN